jgi:predicted metal-binding membrane protein
VSARGGRWLHGLALAALTALAWIDLWLGADMDMPASALSAALRFPHLGPETGGAMRLGWPLVVAMGWVVMVAMMTPGALPLVLLYRRAMAHHGAGGGMNLVWVAALSVLVLAEKLLPGGPWVARVSGGLLPVWAGATLGAARCRRRPRTVADSPDRRGGARRTRIAV